MCNYFVRTKIIGIILRAGHEISPTPGELEKTRKKAWEDVKAKASFYFIYKLLIISSSAFMSIKLLRMEATGYLRINGYYCYTV